MAKRAKPSKRASRRRPPAAPRRRERSLSANQERFCAEYLVHLNAARAYRTAYPEASAATAETSGPALLRNPQVRARIEDLMRARARRLELDQDQVLAELRILMQADVEHYEVTKDGRLVVKPGVPPEALRAVASVKRKVLVKKGATQVVSTEIRLWDKPAAIRMAGLHLGMFEQKVRHTGEVVAGVLMVPAGVNPEEWLKDARAQQAATPKEPKGP